MSYVSTRRLLSSGSDPAVARHLAQLFGDRSRIAAALLDDVLFALQRGEPADAETVARVVARYAEADLVLLRALGADRWPPRPLHVVPTRRRRAA
jgi:hypothetical protein